jgi:hypothetical protein
MPMISDAPINNRKLSTGHVIARELLSVTNNKACLLGEQQALFEVSVPIVSIQTIHTATT